MIGAAAAFAAASALATGAVGLNVSATGRSRTVDPRGGPATSRSEVDLTPSLEAAGRLGRLDLAALLATRLSTSDAAAMDPDMAEILGSAELRASARLRRTWRTTLSAGGSYGYTNLLAGDVWQPHAVSTVGRLRYLSASAAAGLAARPSVRTEYRLDASWSLSGGADAEGRAALPLARSVGASAAVERGLSPRDALTVTAAASATQFSSTGDEAAGLVLATATWRRRLAPAVSAAAGTGVGSALSSPTGRPGQAAIRRPAPFGSLSLAFAGAGRRPETTVGVRVEPIIDRLTGAAGLQAEATGRMAWSPLRSWRFGGQLTAAAVRSLDRADDGTSLASTLGAAEVRADTSLGRSASLGVGVYGRWQRTERPGLPSFVEGGTFLAFSAATRGGAR